MIKVKLTAVNKKKNPAYPLLMVCIGPEDQGMVVLMSDPSGSGTVLRSPKKESSQLKPYSTQIGDINQSWNMKNFRTFDQVVKLRNQ